MKNNGIRLSWNVFKPVNEMSPNYLARKWRHRKSHPNVMVILVLLAILLGCAVYILIFPWDLESSEPDYYYNRHDEYDRREFEPTQFKKIDKPTLLFKKTNFQYLSNIPNPESLCKPPSNKTRTLLIMVTSLRRNIAIRELIRRTWGSLRKITKWSIKLVFVLGTKQNFQDESIYKPIIDQEISDRKDIIIGNFGEEYGNRKIYTHLMAYKWALTYCSNADFILKTTDSTFVDIFQVIEMLSSTSPTNIIVCGKRYSYKSGQNWIPEHCRPEAMFLSMDVAERLYLTASRFDETESEIITQVKETSENIQDNRALEPDDNIFITGQVALNLGIPLENIEQKFLNEPVTAYEWARNGKTTQDQSLSGMFVVIPDATDYYAKMGITDLWRKLAKVNSLVYEYQLSPSPHTKKLLQVIKNNFGRAPHKLNS
ncbi:unnamed protein product [Orchesella dallaii]|uniref:Hexosyltransferase n=1 Tax=Orchesella dallaii TaxID=48710 RepID=A0ABP1RXD9_9HEXA